MRNAALHGNCLNNSHEEQRFIITWRVYPGTCETLYEMELCEQFKQSAQALELLHERKMWNEQKPCCLSAASSRFLRMLFHILSECWKFLARKPFECSHNFHEEQSFAIAWDVMSVVRRPGSLQEIDLLRAQTCLKEIVVKIQKAHIINRAEVRILDQMAEVVHRLYDSVPA